MLMLKTLLNAISLISQMVILVMVNCESSILIRNDRIYRYVGSPSQSDVSLTSQLNNQLEDVTNTQHIVTNDSNPHNVSTTQSIPESILIELKDIKDAPEFIAKYLMRSPKKPSHLNHKALFLEYLQRGTQETPDTGLQPRSGKLIFPKISESAGCNPELKIVELHPINTGSELYFPSCVRLPRCSGCCPSLRLQCVPISKSFEDITVIHVNYSTDEQKFKFSGFKVFRIEKHDNCSCDCKQKLSDCTNAQVFDESECRCKCVESIETQNCRLDANKFWDNNQCECKCSTVPLCSSGYAFNNITCRCEKLDDIYEWNYMSQNSSNHLQFNYIKTETENKEIRTQHAKDSQWFNTKISPEINNDYDNNGHI